MMPEHAPSEETREKVRSYAKVGIPQEDIARVIDIDAKTLRKHYRDELDTAATHANADIGGKLYTKAMEGDTASLIWWTKARMGWSERSQVDMTVTEDEYMFEQMRQARERAKNGVTVTDPVDAGPDIQEALNPDEGELSE